MNFVFLFMQLKFLGLWLRQKKLAPCCACTCGKRPMHFIEDANFETRQRCGTCPPSKQNRKRFTLQLPTMGSTCLHWWTTEEGGLKRFVLLVNNVIRELSVWIDWCNNKNVVIAKNFCKHHCCKYFHANLVWKCTNVSNLNKRYISQIFINLHHSLVIDKFDKYWEKKTFWLSCIRYATKKGNFSDWFRQQGICNVLACLRFYENHC